MSKFKIDGHKMHYHLDRVVEWQHGDRTKVFPLYVEISPVGHCNHRCTFCALDYLGYKHRVLDTRRLKDSLMSMALSGVRSIMFAGEGEPLLHPDIAELIIWTKSKLIDVALTTNAVALTSQFCDEALRYCSWVKISCNAGDRDTYAKIHHAPGGDWDRVWKNIEYAVMLRHKYPSIKTTIGVQCVLLPENAKSLSSLAKRCRDWEVDYLVIKPYSQHTFSITDKYARIFYKKTYDKYLDALRIYASSKFEVMVRQEAIRVWGEDEKDYKICYSTPYFWAYIMSTGDVYGCSSFLGDSRFMYGNVNDALFKDIWLGEKRKRAMRFMEGFDVKECRKNCRMDKVNTFLWKVMHEGEHKNFI